MKVDPVFCRASLSSTAAEALEIAARMLGVTGWI